jgi:hypothetical protein
MHRVLEKGAKTVHKDRFDPFCRFSIGFYVFSY